VEARIAQCLDSRLYVLEIPFRFLTGSREPLSSKTFKPALDPKNLLTQRVRGHFPESKQPELETDNYYSPSVVRQPKSGLGLLFVEVSSTHTIRHTHTHTQTHRHTRTRLVGLLCTSDQLVAIAAT